MWAVDSSWGTWALLGVLDRRSWHVPGSHLDFAGCSEASCFVSLSLGL